MKKLTLTLAILLGISTAIGMAQPSGGGLFQRGESYETGNARGTDSPMLPMHGRPDDQDGNESTLEGGVAAMFALGVLYLTRKRRDD